MKEIQLNTKCGQKVIFLSLIILILGTFYQYSPLFQQSKIENSNGKYNYLHYSPIVDSEPEEHQKSRSIIIIINDLGISKENYKEMGLYLSNTQKEIYILDFFDSPKSSGYGFNFISYFLSFYEEELKNDGTIHSMDVIGFGLGGSCALTLSNFLMINHIIAINPISNFSKIFTDSVEDPRQQTYWQNYSKNQGFYNSILDMNQSIRGLYEPISFINRELYDNVTLIRTKQDYISSAMDIELLRSYMHCEYREYSGTWTDLIKTEDFYRFLYNTLDLSPDTPFSKLKVYYLINQTFYISLIFLMGLILYLLLKPQYEFPSCNDVKERFRRKSLFDTRLCSLGKENQKKTKFLFQSILIPTIIISDIILSVLFIEDLLSTLIYSSIKFLLFFFCILICNFVSKQKIIVNEIIQINMGFGISLGIGFALLVTNFIFLEIIPEFDALNLRYFILFSLSLLSGEIGSQFIRKNKTIIPIMRDVARIYVYLSISLFLVNIGRLWLFESYFNRYPLLLICFGFYYLFYDLISSYQKNGNSFFMLVPIILSFGFF